ncbi:MAG TPA: site-specific integrase [Pseudonocardiaceae bacterium]|nr:site-specific integrase [Pseudonocardiaceae bacterium]
MTPQPHPSADEIEAARLLLAKLGVTPNDLLTPPPATAPMPTIDQYLQRVIDAVPLASRTAYLPYWQRAAAHWPDTPLDTLSPTDISTFTEHIRAGALHRRNSRGGRSAAEHAIAALRCLYRHAVADGYLTDATNPAARVPKPRRLPSTRTALPTNKLDQINHTAATTGNDPALDTLLLRLHTETACRRGGALALRPRDLDTEQCLILLREKNGTHRWQPISPTLMTHLNAHTHHRGAAEHPDQPLLRYRNGNPITRHRYDHLWDRIGDHLPWVATQQISTHWLRHTTLTWVERNYGHAIAHAYAGHTGPTRNATDTYIRANLEEIATALSALTGESHPLATP